MTYNHRVLILYEVMADCYVAQQSTIQIHYAHTLAQHSPILVLNCVQLRISFILTVIHNISPKLVWRLLQRCTDHCPLTLRSVWLTFESLINFSVCWVSWVCWAAPAYLVLALWSHMYYKYFYSQLKATISSFCKQNLKSGYHLSFPLKDWGKFSQCQQVNIFIFISPWAESPMVSWRKDTFLCNTAANPCHSTACCSFKLIFMKHFYAAPSESFQCSILHWQTFHRDI